jgi:hypothetical protein
MTPQPLARHLLRARDLADARFAEPLRAADCGPRFIILHVIAETECDAGHLDTIRETSDGRQWIVI